MKTAIWLLVLSNLDIFMNFVMCRDEFILREQKITKSYPRKNKKIPVLNPKKFLKLWYDDDRKRNLKKGVIRNEGYTFFPTIANPQPPDSPFFEPEPKVRVKKVLPDYLFTLTRGKRSVDKENYKQSQNITRRKINKQNNKTKDGAKVEKSKSKRNSTRRSKKLQTKSKNKKATSTRQLKYTVKKAKRQRNLRNGKRGQKDKLRNGRPQKSHKNISRNSRKKKVGRQAKKVENRRLIAGKEALIADYPYVVSIQKGGEHWCAGALVNQRLVITTANCIWKSDHISRLRVRAGSRHADRGGQIAKIQEVMKHPKGSIRKNPDNDVAFILLDRNIKFSNEVHSLDLPNRAMLPAFEDAWITSWGAERRDGIFENTELTLQVYHTRLMAHDKCNNVTQRFGVTVSENFICLTQTGRRAPCTRDTGAPAVSDGILWGLASWGIRKLCGTERFPAMFSYLASPSNMEFVAAATQRLMSEQRHYPFPDRFDVKRVETTTTGEPVDYV